MILKILMEIMVKIKIVISKINQTLSKFSNKKLNPNILIKKVKTKNCNKRSAKKVKSKLKIKNSSI